MKYFSEKDGSLLFRNDGETVMLTPWGADSLRVRARILSDIEYDGFRLAAGGLAQREL
ncbi:MAG: hypothetical protein Q4C58_09420 [Eubacteriales bacterium]|nr:hypothetical protein [Eubacteriales bacterium]